MTERSLSLLNYLENPENLPYNEIPSLFVGNDINSLFSFRIKTPFLKWRKLKKITNCFIKEGHLKAFDIKLIYSLKPKAYMNDDGRIFFSLGLLLTRSFMPLFSVYLHELAHVWMSQQANYTELKSLQREFRTKYSTKDYCELASPIEIYADVLTLRFLTQLSGTAFFQNKKEKLNELIESRMIKLRVVYDELNKFVSARR